MSDVGAIPSLARDLSVDPDDLAFLEATDEATRRRLHRALRDAHERQEQALGDAFEQAVRLVPRPLRGRVRALLLGS